LLEFGWLAQQRMPPARWDLRRAGWHLVDGDGSRPRRFPYPLLVAAGSPCNCLAALMGPEWLVMLGVESGDERARLVGLGFGDALPGDVNLPELSARVRKVAAVAGRLPGERRVGPAVLDLRHRDARVGGKWVGLFPREFELLWRLSERRGERVTRRQLLKDVWRLDHDPETNRVEVHVSRLRTKLGLMGAGNLVHTDRAGGYRIFWPDRANSGEGRDAGLLDAYIG
jgi:two-component system OmpR family response regulator